MRELQKTTVQTSACQPYTAMLGQYQQVSQKLLNRFGILKVQLREMQMHKRNTAASALEQKKLEQRILLLQTEFYELTDIIREIRFYAEREMQ